eukprot:TRINITY_DN197_c0_g1_i1.p1 TRINITY_DN197_c0_g1~~TRINITY_DN197_c0_g1_i1.p1  ORF type:complete len:1344 (-),score=414.64 TRINITY_DN197_c0_g1_i1:772-4803(-)
MSNLAFNQEVQGAKSLLEKDVYPEAGDMPGEWLPQEGSENEVSMEFKQTTRATEVRVYETFNPGGVRHVDLQERDGGKWHRVFSRDGDGWNGDDIGQKKALPRSCDSIDNAAGSAFFKIDPRESGEVTTAYCDMENHGGGWTLVMRDRSDERLDLLNPFAASTKTRGKIKKHYPDDWSNYKADSSVIGKRNTQIMFKATNIGDKEVEGMPGPEESWVCIYEGTLEEFAGNRDDECVGNGLVEEDGACQTGPISFSYCSRSKGAWRAKDPFWFGRNADKGELILEAKAFKTMWETDKRHAQVKSTTQGSVPMIIKREVYIRGDCEMDGLITQSFAGALPPRWTNWGASNSVRERAGYVEMTGSAYAPGLVTNLGHSPANYNFEATMRIVKGGGGLVMKARDANQFWGFFLWQGREMYLSVSGKIGTIMIPGKFNMNQWLKLRVEVRGWTVSISVDGRVLFHDHLSEYAQFVTGGNFVGFMAHKDSLVQISSATVDSAKCLSSLPASCSDINGKSKSGYYRIDPTGGDGSGGSQEVYCDMETDGGGWTQVMRDTTNNALPFKNPFASNSWTIGNNRGDVTSVQPFKADTSWMGKHNVEIMFKATNIGGSVKGYPQPRQPFICVMRSSLKAFGGADSNSCSHGHGIHDGTQQCDVSAADFSYCTRTAGPWHNAGMGWFGNSYTAKKLYVETPGQDRMWTLKGYEPKEEKYGQSPTEIMREVYIRLPHKEKSKVSIVKSPDGTAARELVIAFPKLPYVVDHMRLVVDASRKWRGIDYVSLSGETPEEVPIPGILPDAHLQLIPQKKVRGFGCDKIPFQVSTDGKKWSNTGTHEFCWSCPKNNGTLCSGNGKCHNAQCECLSGWKGDACETPTCPAVNGQVCNGHGVCGGPFDPNHKCACDRGWTGYGCSLKRYTAYCYFVGDPHWGTFDMRYTGHQTYYNNYQHGEFLEYFHDDVYVNPDMEAISSWQMRPWGWSVVTANYWVAFRKKNDFVRIYNWHTLQLGRSGSYCYNNNYAWHIHGRPMITPDGLRITWRGYWEVASNVQGKNPTYTTLHVHSSWLYMNVYVYIDTARNGKAKGMCGNFDGQGGDLGPHWSYWQPYPSVMNALRVPSSQSLGNCAGANTAFVGVTEEIRAKVNTMAALSVQEKIQHNATVMGSLPVPVKPKDLHSADFNNMSPNELVEATATINMNADAKVKADDDGDMGEGAPNVKAAIKKCGDKKFDRQEEEWSYLEKPWTWKRLALADCYRKTLRNTPIPDKMTEKEVLKIQENVDDAQSSLDWLNRKYGAEFDDAMDDYIDCVIDICESGKVEDWAANAEEEQEGKEDLAEEERLDKEVDEAEEEERKG